MLSERSQSDKKKYRAVSLMENLVLKKEWHGYKTGSVWGVGPGRRGRMKGEGEGECRTLHRWVKAVEIILEVGQRWEMCMEISQWNPLDS
jgi:hypothetical protein